jgi:hypothetical protein
MSPEFGLTLVAELHRTREVFVRRILHRGSLCFELTNRFESFSRSYGTTLVTRRDEEEEERRSDPPPVDPERQWIKIQVVDDETGNPVPGVPLLLRLPGKADQEYDTQGEQGRISVSDLSAGVCDILAMNDDEAWEVVSVS